MLVGPEEAASILSVSRRTVYNLAHARQIPHIWVGRLLRFDDEVLRQWVQDKLQESTVAVPTPKDRPVVQRLHGDGPRDGAPQAIPPAAW